MWACRHGAVNAVCCTFDAVIGALLAVVNGNNGVKSAEARGLLLQVSSFQFVLCLVIFDRILSCTKSLSDMLQSTQLDLARAADLVSVTVETLEEFRSDQEWQKVFKYCESVCNTHNVALDTNSRSRRLPKRLEDGILLEGASIRDTSCDYKISLFYPILDAVLSELRRRFTSKNVNIMKALQSCNPASSHFLDVAYLTPLINTYSLDKRALESELPLVKRMLAKKSMQDMSDALLELAPLSAAFPVSLQLLQIAMTISVSTAKCERCFSALKRIKTYLRNSMSEQRLTDLAVLSIECDFSDSLELYLVMDNFAHKNRRIIL